MQVPSRGVTLEASYEASPAKRGKECQWFEMSPRQSLESSDRPLAADEPHDENAVPNTSRVPGKGAKASKTKMFEVRSTGQAPANSDARTSRTKTVQRQQPLTTRSTGTGREPVQVLPCMRPRTPQKTRNGLESVSPGTGRVGRGTPSQLQSMAESPEPSIVGDDNASCPDHNASFASASVYSEMSTCSSRLDQLSRRSSSRRTLGTDELREQEVEDKKRDLAKQMKRNEMNSRKCREPDNLANTRKSTRCTVPKDFNLSAQTTPRLKESRSLSDNEDSVCSTRSARRLRRGEGRTPQSSPSTSRAGPVATRKWTPQLTVPRGPVCADPGAVKTRRSLSCPPEGIDSEEESELSTSMSVGNVSASGKAPPQRQGTPERRCRGVPSHSAAASERRESREKQKAIREATPERRTQPTRTATPERRTQPTRTATPERRAQPTRPATPERRAQPTRQGTPERRVVAGDAAEKARAERARNLAIQKRQEQVSKPTEHHIFRRSPAAEAPAKFAPSDRTAASSVGSGIEPAVRTTTPLKRRPSFGSATPRPCCQ